MSERLKGIRKQVANRKRAVAISRDDFDFMYRLASTASEQGDVIYDLRATINNQDAKIKELQKGGGKLDELRKSNARLASRIQKAETRIGKILEAFKAIHNNSDGLLNFQGQARDWRWLEQQGWLYHLKGGESDG